MIDASKFAQTPNEGGFTITEPVVEIDVSRLNYRAVPVDSDSLQIVRQGGDTSALVFKVFDAETGLLADIKDCIFKMSVVPVDAMVQGGYTVYGEADKQLVGRLSFFPNELQSDLKGFFQYFVEMSDIYERASTILTGSYVCL